MVTLEELRAKYKEIVDDNNSGNQKGKMSDYATFKPAPSDNQIRILPGKEDALDFYAQSHIHKYKDVDGKWKTYHCRKTHGEDCPMCNLMFQLWDMHKGLDLPRGTRSKFGNLATQIKPKARFYVRAVVRDLVGTEDDNGNPVDPVKYIVMSDELFGRVMAAITNEDLCDEDDPENTTILSLERGNDFVVKITKKGEYNSFAESEPRIKKTKAGTDQEIATWMDSPLDPKSLIKLSDYEEGIKITQNLLASLDNTETSSTTSSPKSDDEDNTDKFNRELKV